MGLHAWQTALAETLSARASRLTPSADAFDSAALTATEREWLAALPLAPGFEVTCDIQRWWRHFRVQSAAPLTLSALGPELRRAVLDDFVESCARPSSFFVREALRFLDFLLTREHESGVPHLAQVVAFERAMLVLSESVALGVPAPPAETLPPTVQRHPHADVVAFRAPPEQVIGALVGGRDLPPESPSEHWLLVAANLPNLARRASPLEVWFLQSAREPMPTLNHSALHSLWRAGALIPAGV
ncbi:MAG TPA: hypothetical protein VGL99_05570 [Chloroflexota bacterium]